MTLWALFSTSFLVALTGALMPGPVLALTISESTRQGALAGPLVMLGHAVLEIGLIAVLLLGLSPLFKSPVFLAVIGIIGGGGLIWMGLSGWMRSRPAPSPSPPAASRAGRKRTTVLLGIATSLSNPYWFVWWATIGLAYLGRAGASGPAGIAAFYGGHILADLSWYSLVSSATARGRGSFHPIFLTYLLRGCSLFLLGLGVYFIRSGVMFWAK
jgi:threonine/homoserine/homoserine lactone efflux protein